MMVVWKNCDAGMGAGTSGGSGVTRVCETHRLADLRTSACDDCTFLLLRLSQFCFFFDPIKPARYSQPTQNTQTKPVQNARTAHGARLNTQDAGRPGRGADLKPFHHSAPMRVYVCASERPTHSCHTALTTLSSYTSAQHKTDSQRPPHDQNTPPIRKRQ